MKNKQLIIQTTKIRKDCYIATELFNGKCLRVYSHKGSLKKLKDYIIIDYRIQE